MGRLRIAILRADDHHHRYLDSMMRARYDVRITVIETVRGRKRKMFVRRSYQNLLAHIYHSLRRNITRKNAYRKRYFAHSPELWRTSGSPTLRVDSINSGEVKRALSLEELDLVLVVGCSILKEETINAAGADIVNLHGGYLPYYKGNHCIFFAVYDDRPERVGATLHFIDSGIDTGNIIEVVVPHVSGDEIPEHLYCRADKLAIERLLVLLDGLQRGVALPSYVQPKEGKTYRTRDRGPHHDVRLWWRRQTRRLLRWCTRNNPPNKDKS